VLRSGQGSPHEQEPKLGALLEAGTDILRLNLDDRGKWRGKLCAACEDRHAELVAHYPENRA
jgi:hypothetical protein